MAAFQRPRMPLSCPKGWTYAVAQASPEWRVQPDAVSRLCRRPGCDALGIAALNRGRVRHRPPYGKADCWWAYCAEHMYGKWVEDGKVMYWGLVDAGVTR